MAKGFYVTVMKRDLDDHVHYVRGPWETHEEALAAVDETRNLAYKLDPWSAFYRWGTTMRDAPVNPPGPMNRYWTTEGY